jgi:hypothetical protein
MTAPTVEAATNLHQPSITERAITCAAPDCGYAMHRHPNPDGTSMDEFLLTLFQRHHSGQYDTGRAPDITVDWEISACCSVCEDGVGTVVTNDSETVTCEECGTTWSIDGTAGELKDAEL